MRNSFKSSISSYLYACKNSNWVHDEAYKFEFANYINSKVKWPSQSDEEILSILINSQKIKYTGNERGVQFVLKSGRKKLSEYIELNDVRLFRKVSNGVPIESIDWESRKMSFTGLSSWLASLFPEKLYPLPKTEFDQTIHYLFDTKFKKLPKQGKEYIFQSQTYFEQTEKFLREYPLEDFFLRECNKFFAEHPELDVSPKKHMTKVDWVWLAQDFHLFVHREILGLYKKKSTEKEIIVDDETEPTGIEGESKLANHMRYERNSTLIKKIKEKALKENSMLNCEVCSFSFRQTYGDVGAGFIEAHHIKPLSERKGEMVTKASDIALVCSNCHRMLHRLENDQFLSVEELKKRLSD